MFAAIAWTVLGMYLLAAPASFIGNYQRRRLLETHTTLKSLAANGWRQFELLVGEAFRRQGCAVQETDLSGPDGGIDLILCREGHRTHVQGKQLKQQHVCTSIVREFFSLKLALNCNDSKIANVTKEGP